MRERPAAERIHSLLSPLSAILYFDIPAEDSDYEVSSADSDGAAQRKRKEGMPPSRVAIRVTSDQRRDALEQFEGNFCIHAIQFSSSFFSVFPRIPSDVFLLRRPCSSHGRGSQSFGPVSLILSCLPAGSCILDVSYPAGVAGLPCRPSPSPPHFSFAAAWRKVHFSRVTCRQRYKGICRAFANIT